MGVFPLRKAASLLDESCHIVHCAADLLISTATLIGPGVTLTQNKPENLYVVSTPIGNLEDISLRALRILGTVEIIAAEDTRHTRKLLNRHNIRATLTSYHDFNKEEKTPVLIHYLKEGRSIALVTDAGTPCISDPGYYLINRCIQNLIPIISVPGPSAFLAALSISGLPTDTFLFQGFLPRKKMSRRNLFQSLEPEKRTLIFYESPYRITQCITDILEVMGDRRIVIARELTKTFEETLRGRASRIIEHLEKKRLRGEVTLIVEGNRSFTPFWE